MTESGEWWPDQGLRIEVWEQDIPAFFGCLCLGLLYAIRDGAIPAEAGIWALGPPWAARLKGRVPQGIRDVLHVTDELDALKKIVPSDRFRESVDGYIRQLEAELAKIDDPLWTIHRVSREGTTSRSPVGLDEMTDEEWAEEDADVEGGLSSG